MTFDDPLPQWRKMATALLLSLAAHLAIVLLLRLATAVVPMVQQPESSLAVQLIALPPPLKKLVETVLPPKPRPDREEPAKAPARSPPASVDSPAASTELTPARSSAHAPDAPTAQPDAEELMSALRKDIGRIDRDLRKERPNLPGSSMGSRESKLGNRIAKTAKGAGGGWLSAPKIEPVELGDGQGRRIYKVTMPDGSHYCVFYESVARRDAYDPSQVRSFGQSKTMNCPDDMAF